MPENRPIRPITIVPGMEQRGVYPTTFGLEAIQAHEAAWRTEVDAGEGRARLAARDKLLAEKEDPRYLPVTKKILGRMGIGKPLMGVDEIAFSDEVVVRNRDTAGPATERAEQLRQAADLHLDDLREDLRTMPPDIQPYMRMYVSEAMSPFQSHQAMMRAIDRPLEEGTNILDHFFDYLLDQPSLQMPEGTPEEAARKEEQRREENRRFTNFIEAHIDTVQKRQQDPEFLADVNLYKEVWRLGAQQGVGEGWLDPDVTNRAARLPDTRVFEGDNFTTWLESRGGFHQAMTGDIVLARGSHFSLVHELGHELGTDNMTSDGTKRRIKSDEMTMFDMPLLDEAVVEHEAQVFLRQTTIDEIDPEEGAYPGERYLLKLISDTSIEKSTGISIRDMTLAASAPRAKLSQKASETDAKIRQTFPKVSEKMPIGSVYENLQYMVLELEKNGEFPPELTALERHKAAVITVADWMEMIESQPAT